MAAGVAGPTTGRNRRAARRSEEQVEVVPALWAEPHVTFKGKWHTIEDARHQPAASARRVRPVAHPDRAGRPRARRGRDRGRGLDGFWNGSGLGKGDPVLERSRLFARDQTTNFNRRHHRRIPGRTMGDHLTALRRYHAAVADLL